MRPRFGDFLAAASEHIDAATHDFPQLPAEAAPAVLNQLSRLTTVMTRCADAFAIDDRTDPAYLLDAKELEVQDARPALRHAAARTRTAVDALGHNGDDAQHPAATCLARATACLVAGHDLLQTHFAPGRPGTRHETSLWAPAIVSAPVNAAVITAMGGYAGRLAPWMLQLAATPSCVSLPAPTRVAISAACRWLRIAEAAAWTVSARSGATADQALLYAIPVNIPPPRRSPRGDERIPGLCVGTVATAERLHHLAHAPANRTGTAQTGLAAAWHRTAQGAAITGHCTELILCQLAESAELPISVTASALKEAAHESSRAWAAWRMVAHKWDIFTTGPGATLTPVAATISDLTLWAGRLAYTDPAWTPARDHTSPARTSTAFTSEGGTIAGLVSALHQIGNALAHVAAHDRENVRSTAANGDLYVPTRLLPAECDMPYRYTPAPPAMVDTLLTTYDAAIGAAIRSVAGLDRLALALDPQPTPFAALRAIAPLSAADTPGSTTILSGRSTTSSGPGSVEQDLRRRGVNEPTLLARAADIDDATQDLITAATPPSQRRAAAHRVTLRAAEGPATRRQHPARLAAKDKPPYTTSKTPLPKLVPINHPIRHQNATRRRLTP